MPYLLDANVFIQAKNLHYGMDFCPAFWDWLVEGNAAGTVYSIEKVGDEIDAGTDDLATWARSRGPGFFLPLKPVMIEHLRQVSQWAMRQGYEQAAVNTFLSVADYYLVAHGLAEGYTIVTHEIPSTSRRRIKIPDACVGLSIRFMTPYQMLRTEHARFILDATG